MAINYKNETIKTSFELDLTDEGITTAPDTVFFTVRHAGIDTVYTLGVDAEASASGNIFSLAFIPTTAGQYDITVQATWIADTWTAIEREIIFVKD
jgi:hypothetical protein